MTEKAEGFQDRVVKGVAWTSFGLILIRVFFFITSIITARLLLPEDFGIIGMAATITMLIDTTSANGIDNFIIYKQELLNREINTAFVLNTLIAIILAGLLILLGPLFATFYQEPKLSLFLFYAGLAFLAAMLGRIPRAFLIKEMRQGMLSVVDIISNFINFALIIYLAMTGFQYLSYVIALLASQTLRTILLYNLVKQPYQIKIDLSAVKNIFSYSKNYLPQTLLSYGLTQMDYVIGGLLLGSTLLGYYYFGFEKAFLVVFLVRSMAGQVFFPIFAQHQANPRQLQEKYTEISAYAMFILYPILFIMLLCSQEIVNLLYGNQWQQSLFTFQCFLVYTFLSVTYDLSIILFNAIGKPEQNLQHFAMILPFAVFMFYIGASYGGLIGLTLSVAMVHTVSAILMMFRMKHYFSWRVRDQWMNIIKFLAPLLIELPVIVLLKSYLLGQHLNEIYISFITSGLSFCLYLLLSYWINPKMVRSCTDFLMRKIKNKRRLTVKAVSTPMVEA